MSLLYMLACQNDGPIYLAVVLEVTVRFATEVKFVLKLHPGDFCRRQGHNRFRNSNLGVWSLSWPTLLVLADATCGGHHCHAQPPQPTFPLHNRP